MAERIRVIVEGDASDLRAAVRQAAADMGMLDRSVAASSRRAQASSAAMHAAWSKQRQTLSELGRTARRVGLILTGVGVAGAAMGLKLNAQWESNVASLRVFLGSAEEAEKFIERLRKVTAESPIRLTSYTDAATQLFAFGVEAEKVIPLLEAVNMAVLASGKGEPEMMRIVTVLGQMQAKGRLFREEMNQIGEAGFPVDKILQRELKLTNDELADITTLGIPASRAIEAIAKGWRQHYSRAYAESRNTFSFQLAGLKKDFEQALRLGTEPLFEMVRDDVMPRLNEELGQMVKTLKTDMPTDAKFRAIRTQLQGIIEDLDEMGVDEAIIEAFNKALPIIAEGAGRAGVIFGKGLIKAFTESDVLGRAFITWWVGSKLGLWRAAGAALGVQLGAGMAAGAAGGGAARGGAAGGAAAGVAGGAAAGSLTRMGMKLAPVAKMSLWGYAIFEGLQLLMGDGSFWDRVKDTTTAGIVTKVIRNVSGEEATDEWRAALGRLYGEIPRLTSEELTRLRPLIQQALDFGFISQADFERLQGRMNRGWRRVFRESGLQDTMQWVKAQPIAETFITTFTEFFPQIQRRQKRWFDWTGDNFAALEPMIREETMTAWAAGLLEWSRGDKAQRKLVRDMIRTMERRFGVDLPNTVSQGSAVMVSRYVQAWAAMLNATGTGGQAIVDAVGSIFDGLGITKGKPNFKAMGKLFGGLSGGLGGAWKMGEGFGDLPGPGNVPFRAAGGFLPGYSRVDDRLIAVRGGEAVLRPEDHVPMVDRALRAYYGKDLRQMFRESGAQVAGMARGGWVTGDTDFLPALGSRLGAMAKSKGTPIFVQSGRRTIAEQAALFGRYGPGRAAAPSPNAPHVRGIAADITPGQGTFGGVAGRFGLGFPVSGEAWHVQLLEGVAAAAGMAVDQVARVLIQGPSGALKGIAQGSVDKMRAAANEYLSKQATKASGDFGADGGAGGPGTQFSKGQLKNLWSHAGGAGGKANLMAAIALAESSGFSGAHGPPDGRGLWQIEWPVWGKVLGGLGDPYDPLSNARMAKEVLERQGLGAWVVYNTGAYRDFMARGGFVGMQGGGFAGGASASGKEQRTKPKRKRSKRSPKQKKTKRLPSGFGLGPDDQLAYFDFLQHLVHNTLPAGEERYTDMVSRFDASVEDFYPDNKEIDWGAVGQRRGEVEQLLGSQREREKLIRSGVEATKILMGQLAEGIKERAARILQMQRRVRRNRRRMRQLERFIARRRKLISKEREKKPKRRDRKSIRRWKREIRGAGGELRGLRRENRTLTGESDPRDLSNVRGGSLGDTIGSRDDWMRGQQDTASAAESLRGLSGVGGSLGDAMAMIRDLTGQYNELSDKKIKAGFQPADTDTGPSLADLIAEQNLLMKRSLALEAKQGSVFDQFVGELALPYLGGFQHGTGRIPQTGYALLHRDEMVTSDDEGPFGRNRAAVIGPNGPTNITLVLQGEAGQLVKLIDARVDGRAAEVTNRELGREQRVISIAPGA